MNRKILATILLIISLLFTACSSNNTEPPLEGSYEASSLSDFVIENGELKGYVDKGRQKAKRSDGTICEVLAENMLGKIIIPDGVTSIGDKAFSCYINLTSITIPDSVISIGDKAFWSCTSLASVTIPDSVTSIGDEAFWSCTSLASVTIPDSVTSIGDKAFSRCTSLASVTIPDSVTSIGKGAFAFSGLTSIIIPTNVRSIEGGTFQDCKSLISITIPDSVTNIGGSCAFSNCTNLTSITLPDRLENIGNCAFNNCTNLTSITLPDRLENIGNCAFSNCTNLTSITIPGSVTNIGKNAFDFCPEGMPITYKGQTYFIEKPIPNISEIRTWTPQGLVDAVNSATNNELIPKNTVPKNVDYDYSKILNGDLSDFVGVWKNGENDTLNLKANGTTGDGEQNISCLTHNDDGSYYWIVRCYDDDNDFHINLYPVGVDVGVDGDVVPTDNTKVRLITDKEGIPSTESAYYLEQ